MEIKRQSNVYKKMELLNLYSSIRLQLLFRTLSAPTRAAGCLTATTRLSAYAGLMLGQRRRRWANSKPTLAQRLMFAERALILYTIASVLPGKVKQP